MEGGRAAVPKREERRGLAKSLMKTGRSCAVVWYGYSVSSPGAGTMCRPGLVGRWWWPGGCKLATATFGQNRVQAR